MLRSLPALAKTLPLCCGLLFIAAAEDDCRILIVADDSVCEDVGSVCNLDCALAVNDEGCEICACTEPPPSQGCVQDGDCREGERCELVDACRPCAEAPDEECVRGAACRLEGRCVDVRPDPCATVLCSPDTRCAVDENGEAVCIPAEPPPPPSECSSDEECGPEAHCQISCEEEPSCFACDTCLVVGRCVREVDECAALCGPGADCAISSDGSVSCDPTRPPECTSDADCATGTCNAGEDVCASDPACQDASGDDDFVACSDVCWGYCVEPRPTACFDDSECAAGEVCELITSCPPCHDDEPACEAPCFVEGHCTTAA
jgi:Cys-rich repeat protein